MILKVTLVEDKKKDFVGLKTAYDNLIRDGCRNFMSELLIDFKNILPLMGRTGSGDAGGSSSLLLVALSSA